MKSDLDINSLHFDSRSGSLSETLEIMPVHMALAAVTYTSGAHTLELSIISVEMVYNLTALWTLLLTVTHKPQAGRLDRH